MPLYITLEPSPTSANIRTLTSGVALQWSIGNPPNMVSGFSLTSYKRKSNTYLGKGLGYEPVEETMRFNLGIPGYTNYGVLQRSLRELFRAQTYSQATDEFIYRLGVRTSGNFGTNTFYTYVKDIQLDMPENDWDIVNNGGVLDVGMTYTRVPFSSASGYMCTPTITGTAPFVAKFTLNVSNRDEFRGAVFHPSPYHVSLRTPNANLSPQVSGILALADYPILVYDPTGAFTGWTSVTNNTARSNTIQRVSLAGGTTSQPLTDVANDPNTLTIFDRYRSSYHLFGTVLASGASFQANITVDPVSTLYNSAIPVVPNVVITSTTLPQAVYLGSVSYDSIFEQVNINLRVTNLSTTSGTFSIDTILAVPNEDTTRVAFLNPPANPETDFFLHAGRFWYDNLFARSLPDITTPATFLTVDKTTSDSVGGSYDAPVPYYTYFGDFNTWSETGNVYVGSLFTISGTWSVMRANHAREALAVEVGYSSLYPQFPVW